MKKIFLLLGVLNLYGFEPICDVFSDVLQTRKNPSQITMQGDGYIYNSPSCNLNTGSIYEGMYYPILKCNDNNLAKATSKFGKSLLVNYSFLIKNSVTYNNPSSSIINKTITNSANLSESYNKITITNWSNSVLNLNFNTKNDLKINKIDLTTNTNIDFNLLGNSLYLGDLGNSGGWSKNNHIYNSKLLTNISINNIYLKDDEDIDFNVTNEINIHHLEVGRDGSYIVLKAPKIVIDELTQTNVSSGNSTIEIYADKVDLGNVNLGENSKLIIHSFEANKSVEFHSNSITASSSSTMIVDSGDYYTNNFSIPGSQGISSIKVSNNNQIVNFYINGDFTPGNNPAINSDGKDGNFGNLIPANFRMFINGDLNTGGGGTTFNALIYVEGDAVLGSPTYIRGGISANDNIKIYNNSKFYYDVSLKSSPLGGLCKSFQFDNQYSCGIFPSVLTSYKQIMTSSNTIENSCKISVKDKNLIENGRTSCDKCSCVGDNCNSDNTCSIVEAPKNKYTHKMFETNVDENITTSNNVNFMDLEYGNYIFDKNNQVIDFSPLKTYNDNDTKLMLLGNYVFDKNNQVVNMDSGDYYFKSFISNGSHLQICLHGDVRMFVKDNFELNGDNVDIDCGGNLFVYTQKNGIIGHNGGGNNNIHLYLYSKGDIIVKNNANASDIYGALTAEGDINVSGNNVHFHYDSGGLDKFGVGKCQMCYDENYVAKKGLSLFGLKVCSIMTPCEFDMPIYNTSNQKLDDVKVVETSKNPTFLTADFFNMNILDTLDKNGKHIGNGATKQTSTDYSLFNVVDAKFNSTSIIYNFGDNYPTYQPDDNYYRAYKKDVASLSFNFSFDNWKNDVVYLAKYRDKSGRNYAVEISPCPTFNQDNSTPPSGFLDSWDNYLPSRGVKDRNISTKIVNKPFVLNIAYIPTSKKNAISRASIKYYLKDMDTNKIISKENFLDINSNNLIIHPQNYKIDQATKNVRVEFKTCANYYGSGGYQLYPYDNCSKDCINNSEKNEVCYRYFTSSDNFAIRPYKFKIIGKGVNRAENNISFLSMKALGYDLKPANNYNEKVQSLRVEDKLCSAVSLEYNIKFKNSIAQIAYLKYPEVGLIDLNLSEDSFSDVDKDDTLLKDRTIQSSKSQPFVVLPDHFDITNIKANNFNNSMFTYLSNDLNMSGDLNFTIDAKNANGILTLNYDKSCYSRNSTINISHDENRTIKTLNKIITQYGKNDKDLNISFKLNKNSFDLGSANVNVKINFDRNFTKPENPFILNLKNVVIEDENKTFGKSKINVDLLYFYGKILTENEVTYEPEAMEKVGFAVFRKGKWVVNGYHTSKLYGYVKGVYTLSDVKINLNEGSINKEQNISVLPKVTNRPYKVNLHLDIPTWLWYSIYKEGYKSPSKNNLDCMTHPCVDILFQKKASKNWAGAGTNEKENNVSTNTIQTDVKQNTLKNGSYQRINW